MSRRLHAATQQFFSRSLLHCFVSMYAVLAGIHHIPRMTEGKAARPNVSLLGERHLSSSESDPNNEEGLEKDGDNLKLPTVGPADVAIFWDYENVRIPNWCPPSTATEAIRNKIAKYGRIVEKRIYYDSRRPTELAAPRAELDLSGFTLVDCPSRNRKETLDKKLIVDVLCFAWERASLGAKACVVLITSDGDYSYAVARLRDIGVFTVVMYQPDNVAKVLIDNTDVVMSWEFDVLGGPPSAEDDDGGSTTTFESTESDTSDDKSGDAPPGYQNKVVTRPNQNHRTKFALFCKVVLKAQYSNVQEGNSVYSSWASESVMASSFYAKNGETNRALYKEIRALASQKRFVEWGRRNLLVAGKPVVKVHGLDEKGKGLSQESYVRLTDSGVKISKPKNAVVGLRLKMGVATSGMKISKPKGLRLKMGVAKKKPV